MLSPSSDIECVCDCFGFCFCFCKLLPSSKLRALTPTSTPTPGRINLFWYKRRLFCKFIKDKLPILGFELANVLRVCPCRVAPPLPFPFPVAVAVAVAVPFPFPMPISHHRACPIRRCYIEFSIFCWLDVATDRLTPTPTWSWSWSWSCSWCIVCVESSGKTGSQPWVAYLRQFVNFCRLSPSLNLRFWPNWTERETMVNSARPGSAWAWPKAQQNASHCGGAVWPGLWRRKMKQNQLKMFRCTQKRRFAGLKAGAGGRRCGHWEKCAVIITRNLFSCCIYFYEI